MQQTFAGSKDKQRYEQSYCNGFYPGCSVAKILNECHGRYKTVVCLHNDGVDCLDTTKCHVCGWNPVVAAKRLRLYGYRA